MNNSTTKLHTRTVAGSGSYGRLGNLEPNDQLFLEPVELLAGDQTTSIAAGNSFTLALTKDGILHSWGRNDKGQLGTGGGMMVDMYSLSAIPTPIEGQLENRTIVKMAAGHSHAAAITDRGELFQWGMNRFLEPELVTTLLHTKCVDVVCGENYTMILDEEGRLYSFGKGKTGVLGQASTKTMNQPTLVEGLVDHKVVHMSAGLTHFACLVQDSEESVEAVA
jgi:alpha-tubulin suppressor-like RCC1 family protein